MSRFERLLSLVTRVAPGEGRPAFLFFLHGFLLLASYQEVKALREAFMLEKFSAETRAYAVAIMALVLMVIVPLYGRLRHHLALERRPLAGREPVHLTDPMAESSAAPGFWPGFRRRSALGLELMHLAPAQSLASQ